MNKTIENLAKAFIGESQARNRYNLYAKQAKKEGFEQIAGIFNETAEQEKQHAKWDFTMMKEVMDKEGVKEEALNVEAEAPAVLGTTEENLQAAINGENYEHVTMYPEFAEQAEKDGYPDVAVRLRSIAKAEEHHEERYQKLLKEVKAGSVFKKNEKVWWFCRECGYRHFGEEPPKECPSCSHPQAYFQLKCEEY
ncbi:MAG: ferritin family protein [Patescibacteria group bacterium]|nr:ferritin family protein [Patescibacteria group bacterium]